jgi:hypothetical protein
VCLGEKDKATHCFEQVLKTFPDNYETLKVPTPLSTSWALFLANIFFHRFWGLCMPAQTARPKRSSRFVPSLDAGLLLSEIQTKRVTELRPDDSDAWVELGHLLESDTAQALEG